MKKILAIALALVMVLALAACGGAASSTPASSEAAPAESTPAEVEGLKIVIITSPSGVDDGNFNEDCYNGILNFIAKNPTATVKTVQEKDIANSINAVADVVADYDVIVTPGFQFAGIGDIAKDNPDKKFILVDSYPTVAGTEAVVDNVYAMQFTEQESGFLVGIAAALESKTGKVAVMNGIAYPSNVNYEWGFYAGVNYANAKYGTSTQFVEIPAYAGTDVTGADVKGNYVGDFNSPDQGKVVCDALLAEGCDVIFAAAGTSGNGAFTAIKENGNALVIGCDVDQYDDGVNGDKNIVLTSSLKNMALNVERQLTAIVDGSFKGGNNLLSASTDSTGAVVADGRQQLSAETITAVNEAYALIKDGSIVPPSNFGGTTFENFAGIELAADEK